ncbi:MAG: tetratricopeptide repeat protein, partial [Alphaproteobacteria bacterium]
MLNLESILSQTPITAADWAERAQALRQLNREQDALVAAAEALKIDPTRADMWHAIGFMLLQRGRWAEAAHYLNQAITFNPHDAAYRSHYAVALAETDAYDDAYQQAKAALHVNPQSADALYMMGEILIRTGHYEEA